MGSAGLSQGGNAKGALVPSRVTFLLGSTLGSLRISNMIHGVLDPASPQLLLLSGCVACCGACRVPHVRLWYSETHFLPSSPVTHLPPQLCL